MNTTCLICKRYVEPYSLGIAHRNKEIKCEMCGTYIPSESVAIRIRENPLENDYLYSGGIRETYEKISDTVIVNDLDSLLDSVLIPENPLESIDRILLHLARKSKAKSGTLVLTENDYSLGYARDAQDFHYLLRLAREIEYLNKTGDLYNCVISAKGWERIIEITRHQPDSKQAFVAMSFNSELKSVWEDGIKPALEQTGYVPLRLDGKEHNEKIDDLIIAEIRKSGLLIADFTELKGGVYFEAGFALGLGIPVIWTCRKDFVERLHFDTRQYNHIEWETIEELRERLINRIEATLPNRPNRKS